MGACLVQAADGHNVVRTKAVLRVQEQYGEAFAVGVVVRCRGDVCLPAGERVCWVVHPLHFQGWQSNIIDRAAAGHLEAAV